MSASVESIRKCAQHVCAAGFLLGLLLTANDAVAGQITLAWDPSEDTVAGYIVYYGNTSGTYTGQVDVGNQTSGTVQGLTNGHRYYLVVRAYSASGLFSAASNEVSGISQPPAGGGCSRPSPSPIPPGAAFFPPPPRRKSFGTANRRRRCCPARGRSEAGSTRCAGR